MTKHSHTIRSEYSAQRMSAPVNPMLGPAMSSIEAALGHKIRNWRVADHGCGKLRHYKALLACSKELFLVDTEFQLGQLHSDGDRSYRITEFATKEAKTRKKMIHTFTAEHFQRSRLGLDLIVSIAVFDVIPPETRRASAIAIARNLRRGGYCLIIVPRNDHSILSRCTPDKKYKGGYVFRHHGEIETYYHNHGSTAPLIRLFQAQHLRLLGDMSRHRQACLWFRKQQ